MQTIHETATITSKGQITLPKAIRQALGVDRGGKVAFDLRNGGVVVSRAEEVHEDPAIYGFLSVLERDIAQGLNIGALPEELFKAMDAAIAVSDVDADIDGDVAL
jgi:antitoxin PrlF